MEPGLLPASTLGFWKDCTCCTALRSHAEFLSME
jgi:hypothetical protein